ncbi:hypothetical protein U9M48_007423 [Paspalum notatum var. saurae]|uniref:Uncharacterized protein n=1 Tax=Paspalum notatum var. saurae TaxID=547442 RepID=A0AAQ3PVC7_PASNO
MLSGTVPVKLFKARSKDFRLVRAEKLRLPSSPWKLLILRFMVVRFVHLLRDAGSSPDMSSIESAFQHIVRKGDVFQRVSSSITEEFIWESPSYVVERSSTAKDGEATQKDEGICPVKLLLLALSATRCPVLSHVVDGKTPVKKLLDMLSTCRASGRRRPGMIIGSSCRVPLRRLKLTSSETMLLEDISSIGRPPLSELHDRLRRDMPLRLPRDAETCPSRPLDARETPVTSLFVALQVMPSHEQQSPVLFRRHDAARPPSCESPARNSSRELLSCSVHELVKERPESSSSSNGGRLMNQDMAAGNLPPWLLHMERRHTVGCMSLIIKA